MKKILFTILLSLLLVPVSMAGPKKGVKVYVALSPAGSFEINARPKGKVKVKGDQISASKITVSVKRFKTGLDLRDEHTVKKMEPKKFPKVLVTNIKGKAGMGKAFIVIKGVKKKISFTYKKLSEKYYRATFKLHLKEFNFSGLKYMGVGVKDEVKIVATLPVER
ncbi:MAG: YceI family protein [Halobacteriovoraceae bacterium]|jgi:hypothetical protein|nr:YceI family protein [Halobacteriovoraceae bacterium]MBT5095866.1 YceI family protein [Halobacteriovoraceae bacterium]